MAIDAGRSDFGRRILLVAALAAVAISLFNYVRPDNGISGTPGALLVVVSSIVICLITLMLAKVQQSTALRGMMIVLAWILIAGTAFAAYLLESHALFVAVMVCMVGWILLFVQPRSVTATQ